MARYYVGMVVRTSYGTGPYEITSIYGPSTEPGFLATMHGDTTPSKPHFCFTLKSTNPRVRGEFYLNGYDENGNSVWSNDRIIVCHEETAMLSLIASM